MKFDLKIIKNMSVKEKRSIVLVENDVPKNNKM